ncbi:MAG: hypothetical protein K6T27_08895, partial [Thermoleophilum sp.]|nr:hypothetical protein [Thermoleophilum sp.]
PSGVARVRINGASASHNGLQLRLDGRVRQQWTYTISYTWSHTIDNSSEVFNFDTGNSVTVAQNPLNITRSERGNSGFDVRHLFAAAWIWDLPFLREQRGWLGRILGGWQLNGILRIQDGQWFVTEGLKGGERVVVGVNRYQVAEEEEVEILRIPYEVERKQIERVRRVRAERDARRAEHALERLREAARSEDENLMWPLLDCARAHCTEGEIVESLQTVFGRYVETPVF